MPQQNSSTVPGNLYQVVSNGHTRYLVHGMDMVLVTVYKYCTGIWQTTLDGNIRTVISPY